MSAPSTIKSTEETVESYPEQQAEDYAQHCGVVMSENEVTNGFVKDGSSLPYIFETNDSGKLSQTFIFNPNSLLNFKIL